VIVLREKAIIRGRKVKLGAVEASPDRLRAAPVDVLVGVFRDKDVAGAEARTGTSDEKRAGEHRCRRPMLSEAAGRR